MVRDRGLDPELGTAIYEAFEARLLADYDVEASVAPEDARALLELMERFLTAVADLERK